jgi:hypothetical protein
MTVKSNLPLNALVAAIVYFKAKKLPQVIHKVLQRTAVLIPDVRRHSSM